MSRFLPFYKRFHSDLRAGVKRFTLRREKYGEPGDVLPSPVGPVRLKAVTMATPAWTRDNLYREEGCSSPEDFAQVWLMIHPKKPAWEDEFFLHEFDLVANLEDGSR